MTEAAAQKRSWLPLMILGAAQFIMVLDSSVMNVSISQIVADLNTTIQGVQGAITAYTLVMAAFMLVGAKLGDMYGQRPDLRDRSRRLRARLADDGAQPEPHGAPVRLVARRGPRRGDGDPGDRRARRRELRGEAARARVRRDRRRRGRGDRGGAADRRLCDDVLQLALGLRRRDRGRHRHPPVPQADGPRAGGGAPPEARRRRRNVLCDRPRARRVLDPQGEHVGLDRAEVAADDRRPRARRRSGSPRSCSSSPSGSASSWCSRGGRSGARSAARTRCSTGRS